MHRHSPELPVRQATRLINHFQLYAGSAALVATGRHFDRAALLLLLLRNTVRPSHEGRLNVSALAASLQRPRESIRRAGLALAGDGLCIANDAGLRLPEAFSTLPVFEVLRHTIVTLFDHMWQGFLDTGFELPPLPTDVNGDERLAAALDIYLSVFELSEAPLDTPMSLYVIGAISVLNAQALTHDPVLGPRYGFAHTVPPDELRRPATLQAVADIDDFPYPTIWRQATAARLVGALRRVPEGYLIAKRYMDDPRTNHASLVKVQYVRRILNDLAARRYRPA
ncbi:hypothetical protein [Sphingomonas sp. Leaf10]|uniref:hypothetical protein n=1 Tax=Sphingomonas sp. Leaf10 TaxID=1735676 RepID=UPI0007003324|nr:hypothetical protein [Sphingomonas sp. Leaf10]KQM30172.1 hypothetical protein ASE59_09820 [Sphingomonas sp. Leaf10]